MSRIDIQIPIGLEMLRPVTIRVGPSAFTLQATLESIADAYRASVKHYMSASEQYEAVGNTGDARECRLAAGSVQADLDRLEIMIFRLIEGVYDDPLPHDAPHAPHDSQEDRGGMGGDSEVTHRSVNHDPSHFTDNA